MILDDLLKRSFTVTVDDDNKITIFPPIPERWGHRITKQKDAFIKEYRSRIGVGVGSELKNIIPRWFAREKCGCSELATRMDLLGVEWCERNQTDIVLGMVQRSNYFLLARICPRLTRFVLSSCVALAVKKAKDKKYNAFG